MLDFAFSGLDEAIANIRRIGGSVNDDTMREDAMEALQPVAETARMLAPVRSGELRDNIVISDMTIAGDDRAFNGRAVYVGPLAGVAFHAGFVEFGTVKMRAQPYLGPAFDENEALIVEVLGKKAGERLTMAA